MDAAAVKSWHALLLISFALQSRGRIMLPRQTANAADHRRLRKANCRGHIKIGYCAVSDPYSTVGSNAK